MELWPSIAGVERVDPVLERVGRIGEAVWSLFFAPSRFMTQYAAHPRRGLTFVFAWTYGLAYFSHFEGLGQLGGKGLLAPQTWLEHWTLKLIGGLAFGLVLYWFGGWWYELRLWMSGVNPVDPQKAHSVYFAAAQVWALPLIAWTIGETLFFENPQAAFAALNRRPLWLLPLALFPFWSIRASHAGVLAVFQGRRPLLHLWFLTLPILSFFWPGVKPFLAFFHLIRR